MGSRCKEKRNEIKFLTVKKDLVYTFLKYMMTSNYHYGYLDSLDTFKRVMYLCDFIISIFIMYPKS